MPNKLDILMSPGISKIDGNKYISSLVKSMEKQGHSVTHWRPYTPLQRAKIFHVHWPEILIDIGRRHGGRSLTWLIHSNFWDTISRVRSARGVTVWTAHNLQPHSCAIATSKAWHRLFDRFCKTLDGVIYLTEDSMSEVQDMYPRLRNVPSAVARHMHMRNEMPEPSNRTVRWELEIPQRARVIGLIGSLTKEKGTVNLIDEFVRSSKPSDYLLLAGKPSSEILEYVESTPPHARSRISTVYRYLSDQEVVDLHRAVDCVAFLSDGHLNSGTIIQSISQSCPVFTFKSHAAVELRNLVGNELVVVVERGELFNAIDDYQFFRETRTPHPSLESISPDAVALSHIYAYRHFLEKRNAPE